MVIHPTCVCVCVGAYARVRVCVLCVCVRVLSGLWGRVWVVEGVWVWVRQSGGVSGVVVWLFSVFSSVLSGGCAWVWEGG